MAAFLNLAMFAPLRHRQFRWMWGANLFSNFGTSTYVLAMNWIAVREHGGVGLGAITLAYGLAQFFCQLPGGAASDRFNRRLVFAITETCFLLTAIVLTLSALDNRYPLWLLALINGLNGLISAFDTPARTTLINELIPPEEVALAQELYGLAANATSVLGPVLGGVLLHLGHDALAFGFNAATFLPVLASLLVVRGHGRAEGEGKKRTPLWVSIREGLAYVRQDAALTTLLQFLAAIMILGMPYQTLLPLFAHRVLRAGSAEFAALSAAVGLGGFFGALTAANLPPVSRPGRWLWGLGLAFAGSIFLYTQSPVIHWASLSVFLAGACSAAILNWDGALLQARTLPALRGRVTSVSGLNKGALSVSAALASYGAHYIGLPLTQTALIILMAGGLWWLRAPLAAISAEEANSL
ncbi:MAG: MFS transporter [Cyanobacteriota bacterium]|jgi:MFS family permease